MSSHSSMMEGKDEAAADCITLHVPLTNATTIIHFRKLAKEKYPSLFARSSEEEEDGVAEDNEEAEEDLEMEEGDGAGEEIEPGPAVLEDRTAPGNRMTGVIERIERMYTGDDFEGYDLEDSFIDDSEWKAFEEAPSTKHSGFFINKGKVELRPEGSNSSKKRKRMAVELDRPRSPVKAHKQHLPADVEEAVHALEEASKQELYQEALAKKRFPSGLDPLLHEVARRAKAAHPLGHFSAALLERLSSFLPFGSRTLKGHMKRLLQPKTESSGSEQKKISKEDSKNTMEDRTADNKQPSESRSPLIFLE